MSYKSCIRGVGHYLPSKIVTNDQLSDMMETSDEWITQRSGIKTRHWVEGESTSDLALEASLKALEMAGMAATEIDLIVLATVSPDHEFPGVGCFLQHKLGLKTTPAFDIRQQCSGFVYGLSLADQYIKSGMYKNILLVGAEVHSKALNKTTTGRDVAVLFGDGAGAIILSRVDETTQNFGEVYSTHLHAQGEFAKDLWIEAPGIAIDDPERITEQMIRDGRHYPQMNGKKVYVNAIKRMCESIHEVLEFNKKTLEDVDLFFFHQANLRINEAVAQNLKIPFPKVYNTVQFTGNTTAATIPICLSHAHADGTLKRGMTIALSAFGSGFTWGSVLLKY